MSLLNKSDDETKPEETEDEVVAPQEETTDTVEALNAKQASSRIQKETAE